MCWSLTRRCGIRIVDAQLEVFVDDGGGYLDLGLDNVLSYNEDGDLIDAWDGTWVTLNGRGCRSLSH